MSFAWTLVAFVVVLLLCWRFLGAYIVAVHEGRTKWLAYVERPIYKMLQVDQKAEQSWQRYAVLVIAFSAIALLVTYGIFRLRGWTQVPIVVLSADGSEDRKVEVLDSGADDCMTKPIGMRALDARFRVALRHHAADSNDDQPSQLPVGPLTLDLPHYQANFS
jgi:DNA-binding response OmpR family regulator